MATRKRDPDPKPSFFDRLRSSVGGALHSANELLAGEIDERTGKRVSSMSPKEYRDYAERQSQALPQNTSAMEAARRGFASAEAPARTQAPSARNNAPLNPRVKAANERARQPEPQFIRSALEDVAAQERGKQLGSLPLTENDLGEEAIPIDPFGGGADAELGLLDRFARPAPSEPELEELDLARTSRIAQAMSAESAKGAHQNEEEFAALEEEREAERLAEEGFQMNDLLEPIGQGVAGIALANQKLGDLTGANDTLIGRVLGEQFNNLAIRAGTRLGGEEAEDEVEQLRGGRGMVPDMVTDTLAGMAIPGSVLANNPLTRAAMGRMGKVGEKVADAGRALAGSKWGSSAENALEEAAIGSTIGWTDPTMEDVGVLGNAAAAGALTRPVGAALRTAAKAGGAVLSEAGRTAGAVARGAQAVMGQPLDDITKERYRSFLKQSGGLDDDVVDGLSDFELRTAMQAVSPARMQEESLPIPSTLTGRLSALSGGDKSRLAGASVAAAGAAGASQAGGEEDRAAEANLEGSEGIQGEAQARPDPNALFALAGSMAVAGRPKQAAQIIKGIVGRTSDEALTMMRRAGMTKQADNFAKFIQGSKVQTPVFHGTLGDFDVHEGVDDLGIGGFYGNKDVAYFSDSITDVNKNYANEAGPDQASKIANYEERIVDDWENDPSSAPRGWRPDGSERSSEFVRAAALEQLARRDTPAANVQPVWLRMQNPAEVLPPEVQPQGGNGGWRDRPRGTMIETDWSVDEETGDLIGDVVYRVFPADKYDEAVEVDFETAVWNVADRYYDVEADELLSLLGERLLLHGERASLWDIDRAVRNSKMYITNEEGDYATGEFLADLYRELGFDGIVMDAHHQFGRGMVMDEGAKHYITFAPGQIKSVTGNNGQFDWTNPNITLGVAGLAMLGMGARPSGQEGTVDLTDQALEAGLPAASLMGMTRKAGVRVLKGRGMSREYQLIANRVGFDPAAVGAGLINQGVAPSYKAFQEQMAESFGDNLSRFEEDLPTVFAEGFNLAMAQRFPIAPQPEGSPVLKVVDVAKKLVNWGRGKDKLTDIWEDSSKAAARMQRAASHGLREAQKSLVLLGDAARWYRKDVENMTSTLKNHYGKEGNLSEAETSLYGPNPMENQSHQTLFKVILAVTSNGNKVMKNMETADKIYRHFLRTGQLTLFTPGTRQKISVSPYTLGVADVTGMDIDQAIKLKKLSVQDAVAQGEVDDPGQGVDISGFDNALDYQLERFRVDQSISPKDLKEMLVERTAEVADKKGKNVSEKEKGIWWGKTHSTGIGHSRSNIHEEQLSKLQRVMAVLGSSAEGAPATQAGIDALETWLTTRYLGGKQTQVKKALADLGDPPPINAPDEVQADYLKRLDKYRKDNDIATDGLLIQYHSIAGPESRGQVVKLRGGPSTPAMEAGLSDKIGRFFLNLYGIQDEATVDLWATRWYRRVMGRVETDRNGKLDDSPRQWEKGEIREAYTTIAEGLSRTTGRPWQASDVQSLLWYWEKELYRIAGARDSDKVSFSLAADAVAKGESGNREWITNQIASAQAGKQEGVAGANATVARSRAGDGAIPTLSYDDLKSKQGISFAMAPLGMIIPGAENDDEGVTMGEAVVGGAVGLAAGAATLLGRKGMADVARKLGLLGRVAKDDEDVWGMGAELYKKFESPDVNLDRGDELLTENERRYSKIIDMAYPLQRLSEESATPELIDTARVGWQRSGELRIREGIADILRQSGDSEKKVAVLAMAQREQELRRNGMEDRLEFTDAQLQQIVDEYSAVPEVDNGAAALRQFYRDLLDLKLEEGVIDQPTYDRIVAKGDYYVPMVRDFGYGKPVMTGSGGGVWNNVRSGIRRLTKGELSQEQKDAALVNPFDQAIHDGISTYRTVAKQRVTNIVAKIVRDQPELMAGLIREVVNPAKDLSDAAVTGALKALKVSEGELTNIGARIDGLEKSIAHIRANRDITKPRWKQYLAKQETKLRDARTREANQELKVQEMARAYEERRGQSEMETFKEDVPRARDEGTRIVRAVHEGRLKKFEVLDEDLFNAWASSRPEVQDTIVNFLRPAKRLLQATVTALPDFATANALRDASMTMVQYPTKFNRATLGSSLVGAAAGAALSEDNKDIGALSGAAVGALPFSALAHAKHAARFFYSFRDVLAAQANVGRAGGSFGGMIGGGVGAAVADDNDSSLGTAGKAAAGVAAGAAAGNMGARWLAKFGDPAVYERWVKEGGAGFGFFPRTQDDTRKMLNEIRMNGADPRSILNPKSIWDAIGLINQAIEEAPRVARFKDGQATGETPLRSAIASRDISLDFQRKGSSQTMNRITESTAFYNAKLQGTSKLIRMLKEPRTWGVGMATLTAPTIALWNLNKDDEEYKARPVYEKNLFWHLPKRLMGVDVGPGESSFFLLPKPFEVGFLFASVPERLLDWMYEEDKELLGFTLHNMLGTTLEGFVPFPTLIRPVAEAFMPGSQGQGLDMFQGGPVIPRSMQNLPAQQQVDNRTTNAAQGAGRLTELAARMPGVPGDDGMSPQKLDHMISGYTGSVGRLANQGVDAAMRASGLDERPAPLGKDPIVGRFNSDPSAVTSHESMLRQKLAKAQGTRRGLTKLLAEGTTPEQFLNAGRSGDAQALARLSLGGDPEPAIRYIQEHGEQLDAYRKLQRSKQFLDEVARARREVENDKNLSREERRKRIAILNHQVGLQARKVVGEE